MSRYTSPQNSGNQLIATSNLTVNLLISDNLSICKKSRGALKPSSCLFTFTLHVAPSGTQSLKKQIQKIQLKID